MSFRVLPSFCAVAALLVAGLVVPASAATPPEDSKSAFTTLQIEGTLTVAEIETMGRTPSSKMAYAVTTDDGLVVPIALEGDHAANSSFSGELVVSDELAEILDDEGLLPSAGRTVDGDSAAGQAATAAAVELGTPLPVAEATVIAPGETSQTATPSAHRAYVVKMVDQGSVDGTNAEIGAKVDDILSYWVTESGGAITSFARQGAILDYDSVANVPADQGCGIKAPFVLWNDALELFPAVNFNDAGNHLIVLVGEECGNSGPVGVATVGTGLASGGPSILTYEPQTIAATGVHELGHNFGLEHANLDTCPAADICEYYDFYSPMALSIGAPPVFTPTALGTLYRTELDLTTPSEVTTVASPEAPLTQSFSLAPRSSAAGQRGLLVTDPSTGTTYSVDWRSGTGRDASAFYANPSYNFPTPIPTYPAGVVIERQSDRAATYLMTRTIDGRQVGSFAAGTTFAPTPRLNIAVISIGSTANVTVTIAPPTDVPSAVPTISGTAAVGQSVTAQPGVWASGTTVTYDWKIDEISTGVTTRISDVPDTAVGKQMTVSVAGSKPGFNTVTRTSDPVTVVNGTLTAATPTISGTAAAGGQVTAEPGAWTSGTSFAYDWRLDGTSTGVTTSTLDVPDEAAGKQLTVEVTGSKTGYTPISRGSAASTVAQRTLTSSLPTLDKAPVVDETVTAEPGTWTSGTTFTYDWLVDGVSTDVTSKTFDVPASAAGKPLTVEVTGSKTGYATASRTSVGVIVDKGTLTSATPTISGTVKVGEEVEASAGTWTSGTSFTYDWLVDDESTGVTTKTFTVPASANGQQLTVEVRGTKLGYATRAESSGASTVAAGGLVVSIPNIVGTAAVGKTVLAEPLFWTSGTIFAYDWMIDGESTGVATQTFEIPDTAAGAELTVKVTGSKPGYTSASVPSAPSQVAKGTLASSLPTLDKAPAVDETVTAATGGWTSGTSFAYDWLVDGISTGVTTASFDVPASAVGKPLTVTVTGTRTGYDPAARTSAEATVRKRALATSVPTISGPVAVGRTVTAEPGSWTPGTSFTYDWTIDDESTGVTTRTYDVPAAAAGASLSVKVTGSKSGFADVPQSSAARTVAAGTLAAGAVAISGAPQVGAAVTASEGAWTPGSALTFAWFSGATLLGADRTLVVPASAVGGSLRLVVTGSRAGYQTRTAETASGAVAPGTLTGATPKISGTARVGKMLKAKAGTWSLKPTLRYQWYANGKKITSKGNKASFKLTNKQKGKKVTVRVTGSKPGYTTVVKASKSTKKVAKKK